MLNGNSSAYGFRIRSPYPVRFLRAGGGEDQLDVAPALERPPAPSGPSLCEWTYRAAGEAAHAGLYGTDGVFDLWTSEGDAWQIDPSRRTVRISCTEDELFWEPCLWGIPALLCFMQRGDLPLHAAAIEVNGNAIVLAAPGRSGKTTLALAFHRHGYRVLTEDLACCRLTPTPVLLPGPAFLRVRPDVHDGHAPGGTHLICAQPERIYLGLNDDRRGTGDPVPIRAIILLRTSGSGVRLDRTPPRSALPDLWAISFRLPTQVALAQCLNQISGLASKVPVLTLHRPLQKAALEATVARILSVCGS